MDDSILSNIPAQPEKPLKPLTPKEQVEAEKRAFDAHRQRIEMYYNLPEISINEIAQTPDGVKRVIMNLIVLVPLTVAIAMFAALAISADKTFALFSQHAASSSGIVWRYFIGAMAVLMIDGSLIYIGFAKRLERIRKGTQRKVVTLWSIVRSIGVRIGIVKPLGWDDLEDTNLNRIGGMIFVLALGVNIAAYVYPQLQAFEASQHYSLMPSEIMLLGLSIFMGIAAPFVLETTGEQIATYGHRFFEEESKKRTEQARQQIREVVEATWTEVKETAIQQEVNRALALKNGIDPSILLLNDGKEAGAEAAVPLVYSQQPLRRAFVAPSPNGNGTH